MPAELALTTHVFFHTAALGSFVSWQDVQEAVGPWQESRYRHRCDRGWSTGRYQSPKKAMEGHNVRFESGDFACLSLPHCPHAGPDRYFDCFGFQASNGRQQFLILLWKWNSLGVRISLVRRLFVHDTGLYRLAFIHSSHPVDISRHVVKGTKSVQYLELRPEPSSESFTPGRDFTPECLGLPDQ